MALLEKENNTDNRHSRLLVVVVLAQALLVVTALILLPLYMKSGNCGIDNNTIKVVVGMRVQMEALREMVKIADTRIADLEKKLARDEELKKGRRARRQVDDANNPMVLDYAYGVNLGEGTSNESLTVYDRCWLPTLRSSFPYHACEGGGA